MQGVVAVPATLTMVLLMMGSMSASAYDEQNGWGLFRLTMPLSRRDVVLGRYATIVVMGLLGMAVGLVAALALTGLGTAAALPAGLSEALRFRPENMLAMAFATAFCLVMGSVVAGVVTPVFFRFGQTRATQYLPMVVVLVFVCPMVLLGGSGALDDAPAQLAGPLSFIESPAGVAAFCAGSVAVSAAVLCASAAVSLRLYERREL